MYKCYFWFYDVHSVLTALLVVTVSYELNIKFIMETKYKPWDYYENENQHYSIFTILSIF